MMQLGVRRLCVGASTIILAACVNSGPRVNPAQVSTFQPGVTTCDQIIATLGRPSAVVWRSDGIRAINYTHTEAAARPETFIPIIGPLVGGADAQSATYTFLCDQNGVLASATSAGAVTSSGPFGSVNTTAYVGPPSAMPPRGAVLGVEVVPVPASSAAALKLPDARGLLVTFVAPGTPAASAGVRQGDVLRRLGETMVTSPEGLSARLQQISGGASLQLEIWREGAPIMLSVTFASGRV